MRRIYKEELLEIIKIRIILIEINYNINWLRNNIKHICMEAGIITPTIMSISVIRSYGNRIFFFRKIGGFMTPMDWSSWLWTLAWENTISIFVLGVSVIASTSSCCISALLWKIWTRYTNDFLYYISDYRLVTIYLRVSSNI